MKFINSHQVHLLCRRLHPLFSTQFFFLLSKLSFRFISFPFPERTRREDNRINNCYPVEIPVQMINDRLRCRGMADIIMSVRYVSWTHLDDDGGADRAATSDCFSFSQNASARTIARHRGDDKVTSKRNPSYCRPMLMSPSCTMAQ